MILAISTYRAAGLIIAGILAVGAVGWIIANLVSARREAGSEIELAANRRPGTPDEELEGRVLDRSLFFAVGILAVIAVALPIYWLAEPGRMDGAVENFQETFELRGEEIYVTGAQCEGCHGPDGTGGVTEYVITDDAGEFVAQVNWSAPALDTVFWRYSEQEVTDILDYGRPGTPMPAWGAPGGGPLSTQQIENVIDYLWSIQLTESEMRKQLDTAIQEVTEDESSEYYRPGLYERMIEVREHNASAESEAELMSLDEDDQLVLGELLFNLDSPGAGAYGCARCHIPGAAYGMPGDPVIEGQYAPLLVGIEDKLTFDQQVELVTLGSENGVGYGSFSQGSGRMPGFGANPNQGDEETPNLGPGGMYTPEMVEAVVAYERSLSGLAQ